jgi:hypothetical protein
VAVITRIYSTLLRENRKPTSAELRELEQAFSRSGFTDGYWMGRKGPEMFGTRPENAPEPKELFAAAKAAYDREDLRTVPVTFAICVQAGQPVALTVRDEDGREITVTGPVPEAARSRAITAQEVADRLKKTGGTAFRCEKAEAQVEDGLSLPASAINALRREALTALEQARTALPQRRWLPTDELPEEQLDPVLSAIAMLMEQQELWEGTAEELCVQLQTLNPRLNLKANALSRRLNAQMQELENQCGVRFSRSRGTNGRQIRLEAVDDVYDNDDVSDIG